MKRVAHALAKKRAHKSLAGQRSRISIPHDRQTGLWSQTTGNVLAAATHPYISLAFAFAAGAAFHYAYVRGKMA